MAFSAGLLTASALNNAMPIGEGALWFTNTAPTGFLLCDGSAVSRTTYSGLFAVIGTTWGAGDGSTTFNLPDLRFRFPLGRAASGTGSTLAGTGGAENHTLTVAEIPSHTHWTTAWTTGGGTVEPIFSSTNAANQINTGATGGGGAHNNMPPWIAVNYIIRF